MCLSPAPHQLQAREGQVVIFYLDHIIESFWWALTKDLITDLHCASISMQYPLEPWCTFSPSRGCSRLQELSLWTPSWKIVEVRAFSRVNSEDSIRNSPEAKLRGTSVHMKRLSMRDQGKIYLDIFISYSYSIPWYEYDILQIWYAVLVVDTIWIWIWYGFFVSISYFGQH